MKIGSIGYNYSHDSTFSMERPNGVGCWLMLLVKSSAVFVINGIHYDVQPNSVVVLSPSTPCRYRGASGEYTDDWIFFDIEDGEKERFAELGFKIDGVVHLSTLGETGELIRRLAYEFYSTDENREQICRCYSEILLLKLNTLIRRNQASSVGSYEKSYRLTHIRSRFFTEPEVSRTVDELAKDMGMSRSGFQHLYKRVFGVSVIEDMIRGRLERAKGLLLSTALTVKEISERCGYASEYVFMRQFKARFGKTPTEYRRCL